MIKPGVVNVKDHQTAQVTTLDAEGKLSEIEAELDRRFNIFNLVISQNISYQNNMFNDMKIYLKSLSDNYDKLNHDLNFYKWETKLPLYKKIWYRLTKKQLIDIYNNLNN